MMYETKASYKIFSGSAVGANHKKPPEKPCQDYSLSLFDRQSGACIIVAADGHGSENCFRSQKGSKIAAERAASALGQLARAIEGDRVGEGIREKAPPLPAKNFPPLAQSAMRNIIASWHEEVRKDHTAAPFTEAELAGVSKKYHELFVEKKEKLYRAYGTTLIACAVTEDYFFGVHIGDGKCLAYYRDGSFDFPIPWDERCFLNETTSVCDEDAAEGARFFYQTAGGDFIRGKCLDVKEAEAGKTDKGLPAMVFVNSDGVDDSYPAGEMEMYLGGFYRTVALNFINAMKADPVKGFDKGAKELKDYLSRFSERGSGDDISIAGVIDAGILLEMEGIFRAQEAEAQSARQAAQEETEQESEKQNDEETGEETQ
jgi:hypothetical protein